MYYLTIGLLALVFLAACALLAYWASDLCDMATSTTSYLRRLEEGSSPLSFRLHSMARLLATYDDRLTEGEAFALLCSVADRVQNLELENAHLRSIVGDVTLKRVTRHGDPSVN